MQRTRQQILDCIKLKGPRSVEGLAQELGVVPVTIRAHLSVLEKENLVKGEDVRSGRAGRPSVVYSLTERAEELFPRHYDELTNEILTALYSTEGREGALQVLKRIGENRVSLHAHRMAGKKLEDRVKEAALIMSKEGSLATWEKLESGFSLKSRNCPYLHVARKFPELCRMEQTFLQKSLNTTVEMTECIGDGNSACTFLVRGKKV
ncbi:MAG: ArsR family transcriptional regulator [Chloroflexi bacterium]|nr:ArsR family transcriptional regulator [Chloroflexota bacterium]